MHRIRVAVALGAALAALSLPASTSALEQQSGEQTVPSLPARGVPKHAKLDSTLAQLAEGDEGRGRLVEVEAVAKGSRRAELETAIRAAGGKTTGHYEGLIEARLPVRALERMAKHPAARRLRSPARPYPQVVDGEGIASTGSSAWHSAQTNGAGVEIAIVDLGFEGWQSLQTAGELSSDVTTADFCGPGVFLGDNHGTAVAEIVHEVAPAAKLHLVCADDMASLGQAKDYVVANDIPIVNHSIGWLNTSRGDGTGGPETPDGVVADARAQGVLWVNAAGNYGQVHWSGTFVDGDTDDGGFDFHDFSPDDEGNQIILAGDGCVFLKWDDWPATDQDFDLFLFRTSNDEFIASSEGLQDGTEPQEPWEELCYVDLDLDDYYVAIFSDGATESPRFDLFATEGQELEYSTASGSLIEPATSPHALAVGAVCWDDGALQDYSSRGPTIDLRVKPDVSAPDAVSTVTYGASTECLGGFGGTSASAPHVTGAAALIKQANPGFDPAALQAALEQKVVDLAPSGKDNDSGAGSLALGAAPLVPPDPPANTALPSVTGLFNQAQTLSASNGAWTSSPVLFVFRWLRCDTAGNDCVPIAGARSATYALTAADVGHVLRVRVTASNTGGSAQALSDGTPAIQAPIQPPANVIAPSLAGAAQFGQSLSASSGAWSGTAPLTISIEWLRCDSAGGACVVIVAATSSTYVLALEDIGATIRIRVTASNPAGSVSLMSAPSGVVASQAPAIVLPPPPPPGPAGDVAPPPPPPPPSPPRRTTKQTRLIVVGFVRTPRTPQAGRKFALVLRVRTRTLSARGATRRVSCSAKLGRKTLRGTKSMRRGVARCTWKIPHTAARKRLRAVITVSEGKRKVRRTVVAKVRGPRV